MFENIPAMSEAEVYQANREAIRAAIAEVQARLAANPTCLCGR